jgi:hypothetical protein
MVTKFFPQPSRDAGGKQVSSSDACSLDPSCPPGKMSQNSDVEELVKMCAHVDGAHTLA